MNSRCITFSPNLLGQPSNSEKAETIFNSKTEKEEFFYLMKQEMKKGKVQITSVANI